jgi:peptide/nickel transport system permease protein
MTDAGAASDVVALPRVAAAGPGQRVRLLRALRRTPVAIIGATTIAIVVVVALAAPVLAPHDPVAQIAKPLLPPGGEYLAGTDEFGRDELSRLIHGARVSLYVGVLAVLLALALGGTSGIVAGFHGGVLDDATMRVMDVLQSMPALVLAIAITAVLGPSLTNVMLAIGIVYSPARRWPSSSDPTSRRPGPSGRPAG